ncbi:MAG: iron ABC transporter permease [Candidatus Methanomethylophilaceae archaeon]
MGEGTRHKDVVDEIRRGSSEWILKDSYGRSVHKKLLFIGVTLLFLVITAIVSVGIGSVSISFIDVTKSLGHAIFGSLVPLPDNQWYATIVYARSSRTVLCILCGIALAISGTVMQNLLRNPLVSPFTLGVSSAASFGAAMGIVFLPAIFGSAITDSIEIFGNDISLKSVLIVVCAFTCGLASIGIVLLLSRRPNVSRSTIILSGVIISYLFQAGISLAKYISDDDALREITLWLMGGMWNATWETDILLIPIVIICFILLECMSSNLNTLSAGDDIAKNLGVNVNRLRMRGLIISTMVTSACISFTGIIGFIGLMAPHLCRLVIGNDSRYLIPASALVGALILLLSDTVARIIISPSELPVGIIMYILGGVFFIWMVSRKNKVTSL